MISPEAVMKKLTQRIVDTKFTEYWVVGRDDYRTFILGTYTTLRQAQRGLVSAKKLTHQFGNSDLRIIKMHPQFIENGVA